MGMKNSKNNTSIGTYVILICTLGAMTFFGVCTPKNQMGGSASGIAGEVGGQTISNAEFARAYERQSQQMRQQYGETFDPHTLKLAARVLDQLLNQRILFLKAQELGLGASQEEIVKSLNAQMDFNDKDGKFSEEIFKRFLRSNQMTELSLQEELHRMLTLQKFQQLMTASVFVSSKEASLDWQTQETKVNLDYLKIDPSALQVAVSAEDRETFNKGEKAQEKIKGWYEGHLSDYKKAEEVHARHILKAYAGARNADSTGLTTTKEEARKEAERVLALVKAAPATFAEIAKKESDEPQGKESGGDLGFFVRESMAKEFSDVAFAMGEGQVSEIVESPFGFHIIKLVAKRAAKEESLEQASPGIVDLLISREKGPALAEQLAGEVLKGAESGADLGEFMHKHHLRWEHTGEFNLATRYIPGLGAKAEVSEQVFALLAREGKKPALIKALPAYFVVKVAEHKAANMATLKAEQITSLRERAAFAQGYGFIADFESRANKEYDLKKAIYKNPEYLALDTPRSEGPEHE